jgi:C6 transcription factor Pro1
LHAGLALFGQILDGAGGGDDGGEGAGARVRFETVMARLGPGTQMTAAKCDLIPSAEQNAWGFSSALLLFDDILAGMAMRKRPRMYDHLKDLLCPGRDGLRPPAIDMESVLGVRGCVMMQIGEIAALDEWKHHNELSGHLDAIELARRGSFIKRGLEAHIEKLDKAPHEMPDRVGNLLELLTLDRDRSLSIPPTTPITLVWTHAAILYLHTVVSGLGETSDAEVQEHARWIVNMLVAYISSPSLFRAMVWPLCVAGCLAAPMYRGLIPGFLGPLKSSPVFGTVRKALEVMEDVWVNRDLYAGRSLADCFQVHGELLLLV